MEFVWEWESTANRPFRRLQTQYHGLSPFDEVSGKLINNHLFSAGNAQSISTPQPTAMSPKGVLGDFSFAAVSSSDGNRCVFFQNRNGDLREAMYARFSLSWSAAKTYVATDTRDLTRLSAVSRNDRT